jgi:hypothetical protein
MGAAGGGGIAGALREVARVAAAGGLARAFLGISALALALRSLWCFFFLSCRAFLSLEERFLSLLLRLERLAERLRLRLRRRRLPLPWRSASGG